MRFFWAEDFNEENETGGKLEERLRNYFDLSPENTINERNLKAMIDYLENKRNFRKIDAFLLDIRFPVSEVDIDKSKMVLFEKYFREFITNDMYNDNIDDAPGLLLYLLLVFRYHVPLNKIVFISAHISNDNNRLKYINSMKEFLYKKQCCGIWKEEDKNKYRTCANQLVNELKGDVFAEKKDYEWLSTNNQNINDVIDKLDQLVNDYPTYFGNTENKDGTHSKYKKLSKQFSDMGLTMPLAFEKPKPSIVNIDKKYSFKMWEKNFISIPYNAIRESIQEMSNILINCMNENMYSKFLEILTCENQELKMYDNMFFTNYLENVIDLLPLELGSDEDLLSSILVKEIASIWENVALPKYCTTSKFDKKTGNKSQFKNNRWLFFHDDPIFYANHSTMKIVRNWSGHQGIRNIDIKDMGWIFIISMRGIFDLDELKEKKQQYIEYEKQIFSFFSDIDVGDIDLESSKNYFTELNNITMKTNKTSNDIYERISGLGNSSSQIRLDVSMDEIYMLYYHSFVEGQLKINNLIQKIDYLSEGQYMCEKIKNRTWYNWKERYDKRFASYYSLMRS